MNTRDLAEIACPSLKDLWDQETVKVGPCHTPETAFEAGWDACARQVGDIISEHVASIGQLIKEPEIFEGTRDALDRISLKTRQAD